MLQKVSFRLTEWFYQHQWIEENNYTWCLYVVEKKLLQICFLLILSVCCILSKQYMNTLVFMATLYLVRGRIGGWHAPYAWLCILLTTMQTWTVLYIVAPVLVDINPFFTWALNLLLLLIALRTDPIYPPQLHFDQEVISANRRKKNLILVCIVLIQIVSFGLGIEWILIFSFNGILVSMLLVFAEKFKQKYGG